jgi:nitrile hydratase accessory protein
VSDAQRRLVPRGERSQSELAWDGPLSPPRKNGELQFAELWESRVFGLTMSLHESGAFAWSEFQAALIDAIGAWERQNGQSGEGYRYWERWLEAFEALAARKGLLSPVELRARASELAARPTGWDHR